MTDTVYVGIYASPGVPDEVADAVFRDCQRRYRRLPGSEPLLESIPSPDHLAEFGPGDWVQGMREVRSGFCKVAFALNPMLSRALLIRALRNAAARAPDGVAVRFLDDFVDEPTDPLSFSSSQMHRRVMIAILQTPVWLLFLLVMSLRR